MNFKQYFNLFLEMGNAMEFLMNPANKERTFWNVMNDFEKSGGSHIGGGAYAEVYMHPDWNYVLKTFTKDDCYLNYARYASRMSGSPYPKFIGSPQRIVPQFKREYRKKEIYIVRIEKLEPMDEEKWAVFRENYYRLFRMGDATDWKAQKIEDVEYIEEYCKKHNIYDYYNIKDTLIAIDKLLVLQEKHQNFKCNMDIHSGNIMIRQSTGDYVIVDPFAESFDDMPRFREKVMDKRGRDIDNHAGVQLLGGEKRPRPPKQLNINIGEENDMG